MQKTDQKQKVPKLRFPEFSGEWEEKHLNQLFSEVTEQVGDRELEPHSITAGIGFVSQKEKFGRRISGNQNHKYIVLDHNQYSYNKGNSKTYMFGCVYLNKLEKEISVPNVFISFKLKQKELIPDYYAKFFESHRLDRELRKIISSGARIDGLLNVNKKDFFKIEIYTTLSPEEQQKIASFLTSVDEWIGNLKAQKESLEQYKKGMMQRIFSDSRHPEQCHSELVSESHSSEFSDHIRFKDKDGNNFPDWEDKRLGEVGESYSGLSGKSGEDFGSGDPFITYKQIFDNNEINVNKFGLVQVKSHEKQNTAIYGDIFFTTSSETPNEVGFSSVFVSQDIKPFLNSFSFGIRPTSLKKLHPYFSKFFFRSSMFRREIVKLAQGSTRYNISKIAFMKILVSIPSYEEQQKIANFLTSIDNLINSKQLQIAQAEEWKRGLMQGLFV